MRTLLLTSPVALWLALLAICRPSTIDEAVFLGGWLLLVPLVGYGVIFQLVLAKREHESGVDLWPPRFLSDREQLIRSKKVLIQFAKNGEEADFVGTIVGVAGNTLMCLSPDGVTRRQFAIKSMQAVRPDMSFKSKHGAKAIDGLHFIATGSESK